MIYTQLMLNSVVMKKKCLYLSNSVVNFYNGDFAGKDSLSQLRQCGDFGLGTFDHLDGEMILDQGIFYQVKDDETIQIPEDSVKAPYAQVTFFEPTEDVSFAPEWIDKLVFEQTLDEKIASSGKNYAIKISGVFESLVLRSVKKQSRPYPTLNEAISQ